ncbi:MAG: S41 family peptidase [Actinomycetota bacterium]
MVRGLALAALLVATALGAYLYGRSQSPASLGEIDQESLALVAEALNVVRDDYVDRESVSSEELAYGAIEGMLKALGDEGHTRFLTPKERLENRQGLSGTYVGIGVQLEDKEDEIVVAAPIEGSPAERAGIEAGDVIVAVNGESVRGEDLSDVVEKVKGPEGTEVGITVLRGDEERSFDLRRAEIDAPVASWTRIPATDVALVRLSSFSTDAAGELRDALQEMRAAGAERLILDLRDNPGGRLDQAIEIAGMFLEPGSTVYIRENASGEREEVEVSGDARFADMPMTVLVNEGSASSAEILAGALRDNGRATVVGETTFGTGTVLSEFVLSDGSAILLGVAEWLTPGGDFIRETGIEPDVQVKLGEDGEQVTPAADGDLTRGQMFERDAQLERAFEELPD